jgi:hypothetical protein
VGWSLHSKFLGTQGVGLQSGKARFIVLAIKPGVMPSLERSHHRKVEEASTRAGLKTYTPNNLSVSGTRLVFQEKIVLEQGEIRGNP